MRQKQLQADFVSAQSNDEFKNCVYIKRTSSTFCLGSFKECIQGKPRIYFYPNINYIVDNFEL